MFTQAQRFSKTSVWAATPAASTLGKVLSTIRSSVGSEDIQPLYLAADSDGNGAHGKRGRDPRAANLRPARPPCGAHDGDAGSLLAALHAAPRAPALPLD